MAKATESNALVVVAGQRGVCGIRARCDLEPEWIGVEQILADNCPARSEAGLRRARDPPSRRNRRRGAPRSRAAGSLAFSGTCACGPRLPGRSSTGFDPSGAAVTTAACSKVLATISRRSARSRPRSPGGGLAASACPHASAGWSWIQARSSSSSSRRSNNSPRLGPSSGSLAARVENLRQRRAPRGPPVPRGPPPRRVNGSDVEDTPSRSGREPRWLPATTSRAADADFPERPRRVERQLPALGDRGARFEDDQLFGTTTIRRGRRGVADTPRRKQVRVLVETLVPEHDVLDRLDRPLPALALGQELGPLQLDVDDAAALVRDEVDRLFPVIANHDVHSDRTAGRCHLAFDREAIVVAGERDGLSARGTRRHRHERHGKARSNRIARRCTGQIHAVE